MWWLSLTPYILPPSAAAAGAFTWFMTRAERPQDGDMVRHFVMALAALLMLSAAVMQLDSVRTRWNPAVKARAAFAALPVNQAYKKTFPDDYRELEMAVNALLDEGKSQQQVLSLTRGLYPLLGRKWLASAQGTAVVGYANALVPVLQNLKPQDPKLCLRLSFRHVPGEPFDPTASLDEGAQRAYEAALVKVLETNSKASNGGTWKPEVGSSQREIQDAFSGILQAMPPRYANLVADMHTPAVTQYDPAIVCDANIQLLTRTANLPVPVARPLLVQLISGQAR